MTLLQEIIEKLSSLIDVPVSGQVPNPRPVRFVTVERLAGQRRGREIQTIEVAVKSWAETEHEAEKLARTVDIATTDPAFTDTGLIRDVKLDNTYSFFAYEENAYRWQNTYTITAHVDYALGTED